MTTSVGTTCPVDHIHNPESLRGPRSTVNNTASSPFVLTHSNALSQPTLAPRHAEGGIHPAP